MYYDPPHHGTTASHSSNSSPSPSPSSPPPPHLKDDPHPNSSHPPSSPLSASPSLPSSLAPPLPWLDDDAASTGSRDSDADERRAKRSAHSFTSALSSRSSPFTPLDYSGAASASAFPPYNGWPAPYLPFPLPPTAPSPPFPPYPLREYSSPSHTYGFAHNSPSSSLHHSPYPPSHPPPHPPQPHPYSHSFPSASAPSAPPHRPGARPAVHSIPRHVRSLNATQLLECDIHLQRHYPSLLELYSDEASGLEHCFEFVIKHGLMPVLTVRYIRDGSLDEAVKPHVEWMMEDVDRGMPCLGVDAETGVHSTRLLQVSTRSRCLLLRIPMQSHTHLYSTHHSHHHHHHTVRIASSLTSLLESRAIYKSGAELWGDALDLYRDLHISLNAGLNMSWVHRRGHFSLSLEHMTNLVLGKDAFLKDKDTTTSDWDRPVLTFRQLVYGALDAQASFIVANTGDEGGPRPLPFHCGDMSGTWLSSAASWLNIVKYVQKEHEAVRSEVAIDGVQFQGDEVIVRLKAFSGRLRWERYIYLLYADSSEELMRILSVNAKELHLSYLRRDAHRRPRSEAECAKLIVPKERFDEAIMTPVRLYLSRYMHGEEPFNPFIASILDLPFMPRPSSFTLAPPVSSFALPQRLLSPPHSPSLSPTYAHDDHFIAVSSAPQPWWFDPFVDPLPPPSTSSASHPPLCAEQKDALALLSTTRILAVTGGPGTGKTQLLVAHLLLSPPEQRSLVLTDSPGAARHLCSMVAGYLEADDVALFLPLDFVVEWEEGEYDGVREGGYLVDAERVLEDADEQRRANRRVLITTVAMAFHLSLHLPALFFPRPLLAFDDANQVWLVKAVLLLRFLTSTERVLVTGDLVGLTPSLCKDIHHPLSLLSQLTIVAASHHLHHYHGHRTKPFTILHATLHTQHRMAKHICALISAVFYPSSPLLSLDEPTGERNVYWKDCRGAATRAENSRSVQNPKEAEEVVRVWLQLEREGWKREEMVVLAFYDAQVEAVWENGGAEIGVRVMTVEAFAGRETDCVILSLASEFITPSLSDRYRINTACSRARQRLYIVGNRVTLTRVEGHWRQISEFEAREPMRKAQVVPDLVHDFPSLGATAAAPSTPHDNGGLNAAMPALTSPTQAPHVSPPGPGGRVSGGGLAWSSLLAGSTGGGGGGMTASASASSMSPHAEDEGGADDGVGGYARNGGGGGGEGGGHAEGGGEKWGQNGGFYWGKKPSAASPSSASTAAAAPSPAHSSMQAVAFPLSIPGSASQRPPQSGGAGGAFHPSSSPHGPSPSTPQFRPAFSPLPLPAADDPAKPFRWRTSLCHFFTKGHCQNGSQCNFAHGEWELRSIPAATAAHAQWQQAQHLLQLSAAQQPPPPQLLWAAAGPPGGGATGLSVVRPGAVPQSPKQLVLPPQPQAFPPFSPSSLSALSLTSTAAASLHSPARSSALHPMGQGLRVGGPTSGLSSLSSPTSAGGGFSAPSAVFSPSPSASLFTPAKSPLQATSAVFTPTQPHTPAPQSIPASVGGRDPDARRASTESASSIGEDATGPSSLGRRPPESPQRRRSVEAWDGSAADDSTAWRGTQRPAMPASTAAPAAAPANLSPPSTAAVATPALPAGAKGGVAMTPALSALATSITTSNGHTIKILPSTAPTAATASAASTAAVPAVPLPVRKVSSPTQPLPTNPAAGQAAALVGAGPKAGGKKAGAGVVTAAAVPAAAGVKDKAKGGKGTAGEAPKAEKRLERPAGARAEAPTPSPPSASALTSAKGGWYCASCTFYNDGAAVRCEMCETERKEDWKAVTTGKKATQGQQTGGQGVGVGGGTGAAVAPVVVMTNNNPFAAVMNGGNGGGRRKGR